MKGTQKRVIAFVLSLLLLFTAACGGGGVQDRTVRVALEFSEAADGKLEFEYSGVERVIAVSTGGENVAYEVAYLAEDGAALPEQPVNAGNYRVRAEVAEDGYSGDVEIPFIILKKQIENLTVTAPDGRFVPGMVFDPAQWLNPSALPEGVGVENVDVEYAVGDGELFTADKPEQPGIYTVRYKIAAQNYSGECSVEFAIRADAEKDLQFANTNVVYDGTPKAVTVNGLGSHDYYGAYTVTYDGSSQPPVDAGEYDLRAVVHVANASDETIEGKLTIQKKNVTINVGDKYFEYTEEIVPDFELSGSAPLPDKSDVRITYTVKGDTDPLPPATAPTEKGEYTVKFEVTDPNFKGGATATYRINARTGKGVTWNGLSQSYNGAPLAVTYELAGDYQIPGSLNYKGKGTTTYPESATPPTDAGTYTVTLALKADGADETITADFTINPKQVQLTAENKLFFNYEEFTITHAVAVVGGGAVPDYSVSYRVKDGDAISGEPSEEGVYIAVFAVTDPNYLQIGNATAEYRIAAEQEPYLKNGEATYDGTQKAAEVEGYDKVNQTVTAVTYRLKGADEGTATTDAPTDAGEYIVRVTLTDHNEEDPFYDLSYTILPKNVTITVANSNRSVDCGTGIGASVISGDISVSGGDPLPNKNLVQVTIEGVTLADGGTYGPVTAALGEAALPADAKAGTYKVTFTIVSPNYTGSASAEYTVNARVEKGPLNWGAPTTQTYGDNKAIEPTLHGFQERIVGESVQFEGIDPTEYEKSGEQPVDVGSYTVTLKVLTDLVPETLTTTLTVSPKSIQMTPTDKTDEYYKLDGTAPFETLADVGLPTDGVVPDFKDIQILYESTDDGVPYPSSPIAPTAVGEYEVTFTITDPNFTGAVATATYRITARTNLISIPQDIYFISRGTQYVFNAPTQEFHTNVRITYEGVNGTGSALTENAPADIGDYKITLTCVTDTVSETYTGYLHIVSGSVNTLLPETVSYGSAVVLPAAVLAGDETHWVKYTFTYDLDGSVLPQGELPTRPGLYTYTVESQGVTVSHTSGTLKVVFSDTMEAFGYGKNYFEEVADSYYTTYCGYAEASSVGTFTYTVRYKNNAGDTAHDFFYQTVNSSKVVLGKDPRIGLQSYIPAGQSDFYYKNPAKSSFSESNPTANWSAFDSASATGPKTPQEYKSTWGTDPRGFTAYILNDPIVTGGKGAVSLNANNQYEFKLTANSGCHADMKNQIAKYSGQTYNKFTSFEITLTLDAYGRIVATNLVDKYVVTTKVLVNIDVNVTHTGKETIYYNNIDYPTTHTYVKP